MNLTARNAIFSGVGALAGALAGEALSPPDEKEVGAALGALFGAMAGAVVAAETMAPVQIVPSTPFLQQTSSSGGVMLTLQPGIATQSFAVDVQTPVVISLPVGAKWNSVDGSPIASTTSPQVFVFLGPVQHQYVWFDASNTQQVTTLFFSVASPSSTT